MIACKIRLVNVFIGLVFELNLLCCMPKLQKIFKSSVVHFPIVRISANALLKIDVVLQKGPEWFPVWK